ncbi:MAG: 40S ribosomal protein S25, partial [Candidatus Thorarchaeota archaeon]|nr:40S ribosomal protein S25 [Candidatus Thorarchaeota archaeon]
MIISKKKWGKSATKTEKTIRDAIPKAETLTGINEYLGKARSVTCYDLANRFNIRMSVARKILREKEAKGEVIPYIRESGFVVYTTPHEMEKREGGVPIMISDALEEVASSVTAEPVIDDEMEIALAAAGTPGAVKPSKLARKRREAGEKKERKDVRPEVIVEPLEPSPVRVPELRSESPKKVVEEKEEKPKKEVSKKAAEKKEEKPKKEASKKAAEKKEEKPK